MSENNAVLLTRKLISFDTINPPGNEENTAKYIGGILSDNGFDVNYVRLDADRLHLIAEKGLNQAAPPIVLSGHLDTVPLGAKKWSVDPFGGDTRDGKIFGRGSSDMKAGVAALVCAAIQSFHTSTPQGGVRLILTANEELGCGGVQQLVSNYGHLGRASAIIVAEPTANLPAIAHKGALYLSVSTSGVTAHSSMPHLGDNAIYKAARAISKISNFKFEAQNDTLLGLPTINVGVMSGGMNLNSVPDHAEFTIDIRSTTKINHNEIIQRLKHRMGKDVEIKTLVDMGPVYTDPADPFVQLVYKACNVDQSGEGFQLALPYLTEGSVWQRFYNGAPTIILGPGQPEMAHQTDEFCYVDKIERAVDIYKEIITKRRK